MSWLIYCTVWVDHRARCCLRFDPGRAKCVEPRKQNSHQQIRKKHPKAAFLTKTHVPRSHFISFQPPTWDPSFGAANMYRSNLFILRPWCPGPYGGFPSAQLSNRQRLVAIACRCHSKAPNWQTWLGPGVPRRPTKVLSKRPPSVWRSKTLYRFCGLLYIYVYIYIYIRHTFIYCMCIANTCSKYIVTKSLRDISKKRSYIISPNSLEKSSVFETHWFIVEVWRIPSLACP